MIQEQERALVLHDQISCANTYWRRMRRSREQDLVKMIKCREHSMMRQPGPGRRHRGDTKGEDAPVLRWAPPSWPGRRHPAEEAPVLGWAPPQLAGKNNAKTHSVVKQPKLNAPGSLKAQRSTSEQFLRRAGDWVGDPFSQYFPSVPFLNRSQYTTLDQPKVFSSTWSADEGGWRRRVDLQKQENKDWDVEMDVLRRENHMLIPEPRSYKVKCTSSAVSTGIGWRQRAVLDSSLCPAVMELRVNSRNIANDLVQTGGKLQSSSMPSRTVAKPSLHQAIGASGNSMESPKSTDNSPFSPFGAEHGILSSGLSRGFFTTEPQSTESLSVADALQGLLSPPNQNKVPSPLGSAGSPGRSALSSKGSKRMSSSRASFRPVATPGSDSYKSNAAELSQQPSVTDLHRVSKELNCPVEDVKLAWSFFEKYVKSGQTELGKQDFMELQLETRGDELAKLSQWQREKELERAWLGADRNGNGTIDFEELAGWFSSQGFSTTYLLTPEERNCRELAKKYDLSPAEVDAAKRRFDKFDEDGSGFIEYDEFEKLVHQMLKIPKHLDLPASRLRSFFREVDRDGNGGIDFEEFLQWYTKYFDLAGDATGAPIEQFYSSFARF